MNTPLALTAPADSARDSGSRVWLAAGCAIVLWFAAWLLLPLWFDPEIPTDNLEQLDWARHLAWGYAKHPPFPTAFLWCFERVFAPGVALTYALGALQVAALLWITWRLARDSLGGAASWVAPLMVACISYYAYRLHYYNHNTALMVAYAASMLALWRAVTTRRALWWALLGVAWGVGMLSKYQMALLIACNLAFLWTARGQGIAWLVRGCALAGAVAAVLCIPHFVWLVRNHFPSFGYASSMLAANLGALERAQAVLAFLLHQAGRLAPLFVLLGVMAWRAGAHRATAAAAPDVPARDPLAASFWFIHAWGPLAGITVLGVVGGAAVENHWGMASLWAMACWILTTVRGRRWATIPAWEVLTAAVAIQTMMMLGYFFGN